MMLKSSHSTLDAHEEMLMRIEPSFRQASLRRTNNSEMFQEGGVLPTPFESPNSSAQSNSTAKDIHPIISERQVTTRVRPYLSSGSMSAFTTHPKSICVSPASIELNHDASSLTKPYSFLKQTHNMNTTYRLQLEEESDTDEEVSYYCNQDPIRDHRIHDNNCNDKDLRALNICSFMPPKISRISTSLHPDATNQAVTHSQGFLRPIHSWSRSVHGTLTDEAGSLIITTKGTENDSPRCRTIRMKRKYSLLPPNHHDEIFYPENKNILDTIHVSQAPQTPILVLSPGTDRKQWTSQNHTPCNVRMDDEV